MAKLIEHFSRWIGIGLILIVATAGSVPAQINTGFDASTLSYVACNGRSGFRTSEAQQGNTNLNGDLDAFDNVLQVVDLTLTTIANVGVDASGSLACGADLFAFGASEANENNTDLNLDADELDTVLHVYNAATTTTSNIGFAVSNIAASSSLVAFAVPEASQGGAGGTDLNGDMDKLDQVLHVYDPVTTLTTNVGIDASGDIKVDGANVAFLVSEAAQNNADLNGDMDATDMVLHTYEAAGPTLSNSGRQAEAGIVFDGDVVAFLVSESAQNLSLNPDSDKSDFVLTLYCLPSSSCVSTGLINLAVAAPPAVGTDRGFAFEGDIVAISVPERAQNSVDLNNDTDRSDRVVHVYRISTGTMTNTEYAARRSPRVAGTFVGFAVQESKQARTDLNGDLDKGDTVAHIYDAVADTVTNTGRAVGVACSNGEIPTLGDCFEMRNDMLILQTDERRQARTDLNGDTDAKDLVIEFWRPSTGVLTNTGIAAERSSGLVLGTSIAAFRASERREDADFNGDSDKRDPIMAVYDTGAMSLTELSTQAEPFFLVDGDTVVFRTEEGADAADLNSDVDLDDNVLQYQGF